MVTPQRPHRRAVRLSPNQRFAYSRFQAAVCSMLERCALRADPVCCFAELAVNFFVQSFMLPCCAIAFNDFSGTNIGMGFRSVITDTDCYIVMERANHYRDASSSAHIERQKRDLRSSYRRTYETSFSQLKVPSLVNRFRVLKNTSDDLLCSIASFLRYLKAPAVSGHIESRDGGAALGAGGLEVSAKRPISTLRGRGMFLRYAVATGSRLNPYPRHQA